MKDLTVPMFNGKGSFDDFMTKFDCVAQVNNWNEEEKGFRLMYILEGEAIRVLGSLLLRSHINYKSLREALEI